MEAEGKLPLLKACETDLTTVPVVRPEGPDYTCYKRRWYILFVFLLTSMMSNALWNTWPPIQATCQLVFGWTNQNTLIIGAISSIASLVFIVPSSWVLNNMGLRFAVIFSVGIQALACIILIFPLDNRYNLPMVYLSTGLIGTFTSICQTTAILVLVAAWFPPSERTTVTVWTFLLSDLGIAISYVTGPYIVPDVGKYKTGQKMDINVLRKNTSAERMDFLKGRITDYMILESAIMTALLVCIFVYFPDRPPKPPCASSATRRLDFGQGIKTLFTNTQFLLLLAIYCTSNGVQWGWLIVMDVVLAGVGINEKVVGWIGFGMRFCVAPALFASSFSDRFRKYIKHTLAILFVGAACMQSVYSLACNQVIPLTKGILFATAFLHNMFFCASEPLLQDLAAEVAFPVPEAITAGVMFALACFVEFIFFIIFTFLVDKHDNPLWMNWVLAVVEVICVPIILLYRGKRKRLGVDQSVRID